MTRATISKEFTFSASHQLDGLPAGHQCGRVHGHNYTVRVTVTGSIDQVGMVLDYSLFKPFGTWLDNTLDHRHLNDTMDTNPTAEHMAVMLLAAFERWVPIPDNVVRLAVGVSETPKTWATAAKVIR